MIHDSVLDCIGQTPVVALRRMFPTPGAEVVAKLEFLNPGGSVKDRPARLIVEEGLRTGDITATSHLVESSSGNFGIALAMVCRVHRLPVTVVVDPNVTGPNLALLRQLGAHVEMVREPDPAGGGYLEQRLRRVRELVTEVPSAVWVNQYANELNWRAHAHTGREIVAQVPGAIDYLVAAVSTAGTIHGVARALRSAHPRLRVVAVDAVGSVIFGGRPGPRRLPGIGANRVPDLLCPDEIDEVITVDDDSAIRGCHRLLAEEGILAGGSSGSVVAALGRLVPGLAPQARVLTLLPDRGERYLDLIYGAPSTHPARSSLRGDRMSTRPETTERTQTVGHIAALFSRVLHVADIGEDDDFFSLGGSSLSAIELLDAIADELDVVLPVGDFYRSTNVTALARAVDTHREGSAT